MRQTKISCLLLRLLLSTVGLASCGCSSAKQAAAGVGGGGTDLGMVDAAAPPDLAGGDGSTGQTGADAAPWCTGKSGMRRGLTSRSVMVGGVKRTYLVYLPQKFDPNQPLPLVFVHHGFTMSGQNMYDITLYPALADQEGIALAFPDGEGGPNALSPPWNVGTGVCGAGSVVGASGDDFGFIEAMRSDIESDQCIDDAHVFLTGFSMGGYFAHQVGCMRPDLARAIAPHSGGTHDFSACVPGHRPVIMFHGTSDGVIDPNCAKAARDQWVAKNGCGPTVTTVAVMGGHCEWSDACPADGQVVLCLFDGLQHEWAGGAPNMLNSDPNFESATRLQWSFFKEHAW